MKLAPASSIHPSKDKNMVPSSREGGDDGMGANRLLALEGVDDNDDDRYNTETEPARTSGDAQSDEEHSTSQRG